MGIFGLEKLGHKSIRLYKNFCPADSHNNTEWMKLFSQVEGSLNLFQQDRKRGKSEFIYYHVLNIQLFYGA